MRNSLFAAVITLLIFSACTKSIKVKQPAADNNEPPTITIISPSVMPTVKAGDQIEVKAVLSDKDLVFVAAWEALRASSGVCGSSPYHGQFEPKSSEYEMNFKFTVPSNFGGVQTIRISGMDGKENKSTADISYTSSN